MTDPPARVAAAEALLDRGWGKPKQSHEVETMHRHVIEVPPLSLLSAEWESEALMPPTRAAPAVASEGDRIRARNERAWLHRRSEYGDRISLG